MTRARQATDPRLIEQAIHNATMNLRKAIDGTHPLLKAGGLNHKPEQSELILECGRQLATLEGFRR